MNVLMAVTSCTAIALSIGAARFLFAQPVDPFMGLVCLGVALCLVYLTILVTR